LGGNTTGSYNTAFGGASLDANTTASNNTAFGFKALTENTTGSSNTAVGNQAMESATTAAHNTVVGFQAGEAMTTGSYNTFIGTGTIAGTGNFGAGALMTTGDKNVILGGYNGNQNSLDLRTADNNIVLSDGDGNPRVKIDSSGDFFLAKPAGHSLTTTGVGLRANSTSSFFTSGNDNIPMAIGSTNDVTLTLVTFHGASATAAGSISVSSGNSIAYNTSSDYRLKENLDYIWDATTRLKQLKPLRFNWISDDTDTLIDGFLAHEVSTVVPEAIHGAKDAVDDDGVAVMQGIDQSKLVPLLVKTIQELEARITTLEG
jgi:hypothetical protein